MKNQERFTIDHQTKINEEVNQGEAKLQKQIAEYPMITRSKAGIFEPKIYSIQCKEYTMKSEPNHVPEALLNKNRR